MVYICPKDLDKTFLDNNSGKIFLCYDNTNEMHLIRQKCHTTLTLTSILSEDPLVFPESTGISLDPENLPFILIEAHLINPFPKEVNISLVFRTWMTSKIS